MWCECRWLSEVDFMFMAIFALMNHHPTYAFISAETADVCLPSLFVSIIW